TRTPEVTAMDLEQELRRSLHRLGDDLDVTPPGVEAVSRHARRRHRRRQAMGAATTAVVVAVSALAITRAAGDGDSAPGMTASAAAVEQVTPAAGVPLQWSVLDDRGEVGTTRAVLTADDGTIYALSTASGT